METLLLSLSIFAYFSWLALLLLPWRPWLNTETLEPDMEGGTPDFRNVTVLIPARNEAESIAETLTSLAIQGLGLKVVVVDDGSDDGTGEIAKSVTGLDVTVVEGQALPEGWIGKLWALEQGYRHIKTPWMLLLDADIALRPGMLSALLDKAHEDNRQFVSIMAHLRMDSCWEKLLMPAFIYFFKLLYPFKLANSDFPHIAAAAGGCVLMETRLIKEIGGFATMKEALIDDCTLAKRVKAQGNRIWIGQSHSVVSTRAYNDLPTIWDMVARSAFTQLRYSSLLLGLCTLLMGALFLGPLAALIWGSSNTQSVALVGLVCLCASYWPTLSYYRRKAAWMFALPVIAVLYLAMTWTSAIRYWRGDRSRWKNRVYAVGN